MRKKKRGGLLHQLCIVLYIRSAKAMYTYLDLHMSISSHNKKYVSYYPTLWVVMNGYRVND